MEVREPDARYLTAVQRTELGEFPADWQVVPLGEFEPFITSGSRGWAAYYADMGSTFLRITNLSRSCIYPSLQDLRYVAVPPGNSEGVRTALRAGDVLISITADIGIVGFVTEALELPAYINQHIALVRLDGREVNSRYVAYFLAGEAAQRRFKSMTDAGAKAGMNLAGVRDVLAALPPRTDEQAAIADSLTDADALIDSLEQLLNTPDLVGEVGYVDRAYDWLYLPDRVWMTRMRSPDCVCVRWLGYLLSSPPYKRLIGDTATGTSGSMKNIAKSGLLRLPLRLPEVDEQRAIAAGLADMDAEITVLESRLTKAHALKQSVAQALLTGRIRLVEPSA